MEQQHPDFPKARRNDLLVEKVGDETILYDGQRQLAHSLNRSASIVWENSDGEHSVPELAQLVSAEMGIEPNDSVVEYALDKLASANLLEDNHVSRRDVVRRMTLAGAAALALPVVLSVVAPTEAMAASGQNSQGQNNNKQGQNGQ
jgi:DNA-binding PadR family transcriptional regulator